MEGQQENRVQYHKEYQAEDTSAARLNASAEGVRRFQAAGIGLSAHRGLYSLSTEGHEWIYYESMMSR